MGILKCIGKNMPEKSRLLLVNGILKGKINYLMPLYGGTNKKYLNKIQIIMNNSVKIHYRGRKKNKIR